MKRGLQLELSLGKDDEFSGLENTYRNEGLSVGADHMRLFGEEVHLEVQFTDLMLGDKIGQGACSAVNVAKHRRTKEPFAIKMFNIYDRAQASQLYNEILLLTSFQCDALISLKGAFHDQGQIGIILEYMDRGSLEFFSSVDMYIPEDVLASVAFQMVWGLGYLHYEKQLHRDIKPGNALLNSIGQVKLSDFGISKGLDSTQAMSNSAVGSYRYMSPERLLGEKYDASADIWSLGITLMEIWNQSYPFAHCAQTPIHLVEELNNFQPDRVMARVKKISPELRDFICALLAYDPADRCNCMELATFPWFETCRITSLPEAHWVLALFFKQVDQQRKAKMALPKQALTPEPPKRSSASSIKALPPKNVAAAIVRDVCEMSISLDVSKGWDVRDASFNRSMNPFTSSGSMSISSGNLSQMLPAHNNFSIPPPTSLSSTTSNSSTSSSRGYTTYGSSSSSTTTTTTNNNNNNNNNGGGGQRKKVHELKRIVSEDDYEDEDFEVDDSYDPMISPLPTNTTASTMSSFQSAPKSGAVSNSSNKGKYDYKAESKGGGGGYYDSDSSPSYSTTSSSNSNRYYAHK